MLKIWDSRAKKMISLDKVGRSFSAVMSDDSLVKLRFTGLVDKRGQKIFEGDIVSKQKYYKGKQNGLVVRTVEYKTTACFVGFNLGSDTSSTEVIGNIYEVQGGS